MKKCIYILTILVSLLFTSNVFATALSSSCDLSTAEQIGKILVNETYNAAKTTDLNNFENLTSAANVLTVAANKTSSGTTLARINNLSSSNFSGYAGYKNNSLTSILQNKGFSSDYNKIIYIGALAEKGGYALPSNMIYATQSTAYGKTWSKVYSKFDTTTLYRYETSLNNGISDTTAFDTTALATAATKSYDSGRSSVDPNYKALADCLMSHYDSTVNSSNFCEKAQEAINACTSVHIDDTPGVVVGYPVVTIAYYDDRIVHTASSLVANQSYTIKLVDESGTEYIPFVPTTTEAVIIDNQASNFEYGVTQIYLYPTADTTKTVGGYVVNYNLQLKYENGAINLYEVGKNKDKSNRTIENLSSITWLKGSTDITTSSTTAMSIFDITPGYTYSAIVNFKNGQSITVSIDIPTESTITPSGDTESTLIPTNPTPTVDDSTSETVSMAMNILVSLYNLVKDLINIFRQVWSSNANNNAATVNSANVSGNKLTISKSSNSNKTSSKTTSTSSTKKLTQAEVDKQYYGTSVKLSEVTGNFQVYDPSYTTLSEIRVLQNTESVISTINANELYGIGEVTIVMPSTYYNIFNGTDYSKSYLFENGGCDLKLCNNESVTESDRENYFTSKGTNYKDVNDEVANIMANLRNGKATKIIIKTGEEGVDYAYATVVGANYTLYQDLSGSYYGNSSLNKLYVIDGSQSSSIRIANLNDYCKDVLNTAGSSEQYCFLSLVNANN